MCQLLPRQDKAIRSFIKSIDIPANKCITKAEFDELIKYMGYIPDEAPNGVHIMHRNGRLFHKEYWTVSNSNASGIALKTENVGFVIAKDAVYDIIWGNNGVNVGGFMSEIEEIALTDLAGQENTSKIISDMEAASYYAAKYCYEYQFIHGKNGYLPALGEWREVEKNINEIDDYMNFIGGIEIMGNPDLEEYSFKWSSTQSHLCCAWYFSTLYGETGYNYQNKKTVDSLSCARPFAPF